MVLSAKWVHLFRKAMATIAKPNLQFQGEGRTSKPANGRHGRIGLEVLEDRAVPAYVPALGWGETDGYPQQSPGAVTASLQEYGLQIEGQFFESVNASVANNGILGGTSALGYLYNKVGPVITLAGGRLQLAGNIEFGRAASYLAPMTPGNEILVNSSSTKAGATLTALNGDALKNLTTTVKAGSQVILGDKNAPASTVNSYVGLFQVAGGGIEGAGVIQAQAGVNFLRGPLTRQGSGSLVVAASKDAVLIVNGPVNGARSLTSFAKFVTKGEGKVLLDNVFPVAMVSLKRQPDLGVNLITFVVNLSEPVQSELETSSLSVVNGTVTAVNKISSTKFEFTVESSHSSGATDTVSAFLGSETIRDFAYLGNLKSNVATVKLDLQNPSGSGTFSDLGKESKNKVDAKIYVSFTDGKGVGIDHTTIANNNILVTTQTGKTLEVKAGPTFDPISGKATFVVQSGSTWGKLAETGPLVVTVSLVSGTVGDKAGNKVEGVTLGTFKVDVSKVVTNTPPVFSGPSQTTFEMGKRTSFTLVARGSPAPLIKLVQGVLPAGVTFDSSTRLLIGTPAEGTAGFYPLVFALDNNVGPVVLRSFKLTVGVAPGITSPADATFDLGSEVSFRMLATGFPAPTFGLSGGKLMDGLKLDSKTGLISGTPKTKIVGEYGFTIFAKNGIGVQAVQKFTLTLVPPKNDAPSGENKTITILEDSRYEFKVADFGFSDVKDTPAHSLASVMIVTLPVGGTLFLDGAPLKPSGEVLVSAIKNGSFVYIPPIDANGTAVASFTFQVKDNGGVANGGTNLDPSPNTIVFDVISVNDTPNGTNLIVYIPRGQNYAFNGNEFGFTDAYDTPSNVLSQVLLTTIPKEGYGTLLLRGVKVQANRFVRAEDMKNGYFEFVPSDAPGTQVVTFTFQLKDNGGNANDGINLDPVANTVTLVVS